MRAWVQALVNISRKTLFSSSPNPGRSRQNDNLTLTLALAGTMALTLLLTLTPSHSSTFLEHIVVGNKLSRHWKQATQWPALGLRGRARLN